MRIAIMLRHFNQHGGGVWVYSHNLLNELLALNSPHEFVLVYQDPKLVGTFRQYKDRVRELAVKVPTTILWDQLALCWAEQHEKFDLIFNPKYSLPLFARCRTAFVCHGLDWYVMPWGSKFFDRLNHRFLIPRYTQKADAVIAVSNTAREHVMQYLKVPGDRVHRVYHGISDLFRQPACEEKKAEVRRKYGLPDRYFLYVGQIYPPKNFGRLLQAFAEVGPKKGIPLVVAGEHRWLSSKELALIEQLGISPWVKQIGWIGHETLPALYAQAEALLLPSLYESFGFPILEAMSAGCPVVTADRCATKELALGAGVLVDPEDVASIAAGMLEIIEDSSLREWLVEAGRERAECFTWKRCAFETLRILEVAAQGSTQRLKPALDSQIAGLN